MKYELLRHLGLSKMAIACYRSLDREGSTTAAELAKRLNVQVNGLYRVLKQLEGKGFLSNIKVPPQPNYYYPNNLTRALELYFDHQRRIMQPLIKLQKERLMSKY